MQRAQLERYCAWTEEELRDFRGALTTQREIDSKLCT